LAADQTPALSALDARWDLTFRATPAAGAGFDADTAFVPLRDGGLVAVDLDSGRVRWRRAFASAHPPATGGGLVFLATADAVVALSASSGHDVWTAPLPGPLAVQPYWDTGWLLVSTADGTLVAYRASDGVELWRRALGSPLSAMPAPALDRLYLGLADGRLLSVALATGDELWVYQFDGHITGIVALDEQLVVGSTDNRVTSLDLVLGRERWRWRVGGDPAGAPIADGDAVYFAALDNVLRAVSRRTGNLRWSRPLTARPAPGLLQVGSLVLLPYVSAEIGAFRPADGTPVFTINAAGEVGARPFLRLAARPTAAQVFILSRSGTLQGFGVRFEPPSAPLQVLPGMPVEP